MDASSKRKWVGVGVASAIWSLWAVLPGALLTTSVAHTQAFAAAQIGAASAPYLQGAPGALSRYLIVSQGVVLPALIALAWTFPGRAGADEPSAHAVRRYLRTTLLPFLGCWLALYTVGNMLMAALDIYRGVEVSVVRGYGFHLGVYGFLATLPQWGWVLVCRTLIRRSWLSALVGVLGGAVAAIASVMLRARHLAWPTPAFLRNELFSGRADAVTHAQLGFLLWGFALTGVALACLFLPTLSRANPARVDEGA
jgi:hypothetical protein